MVRTEILMKALKAICSYVEKYRPKGEAALNAQLLVIHEIALSAVEEAEYNDGASQDFRNPLERSAAVHVKKPGSPKRAKGRPPTSGRPSACEVAA
jgi:hypothetical protein